MSRAVFFSRSVLSVAALATVLATGACTDSTGPTGEQPTAKSDRDTPPPAASRELKPSLAVQTSQWVTPPWIGPGPVTIPASSTTGTSESGLRMLDVNKISVGEIPGNMGNVAMSAVGVFYFWRWNGSSWVLYSSATVSKPIPLYPFAKVVLPDAGIFVFSSGYYTVTAKISWVSYGVTVAYRTYTFNSVTDYATIGSAVKGPGWVYLY